MDRRDPQQALWKQEISITYSVGGSQLKPLLRQFYLNGKITLE